MDDIPTLPQGMPTVAKRSRNRQAWKRTSTGLVKRGFRPRGTENAMLCLEGPYNVVPPR